MQATPERREAPPRYWIFQARRERYDLEKELIPQESAPWGLNQYRDRIRVGDVVFLWNTGEDRNLYGWGKIASLQNAGQKKKGESKAKAIVIYVDRFKRPLSRQELALESLLEAMTILRTPAGTNFRVTTLEARRLVEMLRDRGEPAPPEPDRFAEGAYPLVALQELRFSGEIQGLIGDLGARRGEGGVIDLPLLTDVVIRKGHEDASISQLLLKLGFQPTWNVLPTAGGVLAPDDPTWVRIGLEDGCLEAFELARRVAITTTRSETIHLRHLLGALLLLSRLSTPSAGASRVDKTILRLGGKPDPLRAGFFDLADLILRDPEEHAWARLASWGSSPPDDVSWMREVWKAAKDPKGRAPEGHDDPAAAPIKEAPEGEATPAPSTETEPTELERARGLLLGPPILSDRVEARDFLNLEDEHRAFARLLSDQATELPLAIGLFGHWGAGKSTFLKNLEREIAAKNDPDDPGARFHVAQVRFNAWHYMEADVWASLADHLFRSLDQEVRVERKKKDEMATLISELENANLVESRLEQELEELDRQIEVAETEVAAARAVEEERQKTLEGQREIILHSLASKETKARCLDFLEEVEGLFGGTRLRQIRERVEAGQGELLDLSKEMDRARDELRGVGKETTSLLGSLRRRWLVLAGLVLLSLVGVLAWTPLLELWMKIGGSVVAFIATFVPVVVRVRARARDLRKSLDDLVERIDKDQEERLEKNQAFSRAQKAKEEAERKRTAVELQLREWEQKKKRLNEKLTKKPPELRILEFIASRAEANEYNQRLGTLALVRRDFKKLSDLLIEQRNGENDPALPGIRRIILYIDDLDRCPHHRVMAVLEAVHLLLAFPLFAVVVAVDARWVRRSVSLHLERMAKNGSEQPIDLAPANGDEEGDDGRATPQEYLEKIIQVPFWLKPLEPEQRSGLLLSMLERASGLEGVIDDANGEEEFLPSAPEDEQASEGGEGLEDPERIGTEDEASEGPDPSDRSDAEPEAEKEQPAEEGGDAGDGASDVVDNEAPAEEGEDLLAPFATRSLSEAEVAFFPVLAALLGSTPRSVKRFLSLYGIFRAFRPDTEEERYHGAGGEHQEVQLLYAILTGWPEVSFPFFRILHRNSDQTSFFEYARLLQQEFLGRMEVDRSDGAPEFEDVDADHWSRFFEALVAAAEVHDELPDSHPVSVNTMVGWLPFVTRFAFDDWSDSRHAF